MPFTPEQPRFKGISLPPSGWVLAILLTIYIFIGLIGHDPWKHDDAISIGIAYDIVTNGHWLVPQLAGQVYIDAPLYYWVSACTAHLFSWLLPFHDAARLASGLFTLLALEFILLAARELYGRERATAAPLILAGSIGFLFHAHEAQPMLAALTAYTAAYWALTLMPRRPGFATSILGFALALGFLANGLLPVLTLLPVMALSIWLSPERARCARHVALSVITALLIVATWLVPLQILAPNHLSEFLQHEAAELTSSGQQLYDILRYLNTLLWYAWPALPLAAWALWSKRRFFATRPIALPAYSFLAVLLMLGLGVELKSSSALLLLPPLVLLAVPGVTSLRRGAANAFDWFGMMTFTFFAAVVWIAWAAMVFGWPERLSRQVVRLEPGFVGHFSLIAFVFSVAITAVWFWLIVTSPRSPMRGIMHWMAGLTLFWVLLAALWMPWIDYGKSYRPVAESLTQAMQADKGCVTSVNLQDSIRASLNYFANIHTIPQSSASSRHCDWLLIHGEPRNEKKLSAAGWQQTWEGKRPGDRHRSTVFHLYRRQANSQCAEKSKRDEVTRADYSLKKCSR